MESLSSMEPGTIADKEQALLRKFPTTICGLLDEPTIILGEGGTVALWYLPGALSRPTQVGFNTSFLPWRSVIHIGKYLAGYKSSSIPPNNQYHWLDLVHRTMVFQSGLWWDDWLFGVGSCKASNGSLCGWFLIFLPIN